MRIDEVAAWHVVELETDAFDKSVTSRGLTAEVSAYSRSRGATKDFSSGARGSLCFLRALDVGGGVSVFGYRLSFRKGSSAGHASGPRRDNGGAATLRFGPTDGIEMRA